MTAVLSGGGIREGQVIGKTTPDGAYVADAPYGPGDLLATIYQILGVDTKKMFSTREGRPMPILETGQPIKELL